MQLKFTVEFPPTPHFLWFNVTWDAERDLYSSLLALLLSYKLEDDFENYFYVLMSRCEVKSKSGTDFKGFPFRALEQIHHP